MRRAVALAVLAPAAAAAAPSAAAPPRGPLVPRVVEFSIPVPAGTARAGAASRVGAGRVQTPVLRTSRRFDLLGLRWRGPASARVALRVRLASGRWTRWSSVSDAGGHGPDGSSPIPGTEPVWVGGADALQLRLPRSLHAVRVHFVNSTGTATAADRRRPRAVPAAAGAAPGGQPRIIPRRDWAGSQCRPHEAPSYGTVRMAFVHHTDNLNGYGPGQSAAIVLAICRFHRDVNGWGDIGYNFLVDRYGQIFEGRAGGIDQAVVGAQTAGFNTVSTGVANIGTFVSTPQTAAGMRALAQLLAWKLTLHGVPATGRLTLVTTRRGLRGLPLGARIRLNRIAGHRDANSTDCPGDALYARLPSLRRTVASLAAPLTTVSLASTPDPVAYGGTAVLSGRVTRAGGAPVAGTTLTLQALGGGATGPVGTVVTGPDGSWSTTLTLVRTTTLRASYSGDGANVPAVSPALVVGVVPSLVLDALPRTAAANSAIAVTGTIRPGKRSLAVMLERRVRGRYRTVARRTVAAASGAYSTTVRTGPVGTYRVRVSFSGDGANAATSASARIAVT